MSHLVSVLTPTHNARWLRETYDSLCGQQDCAWEWVLATTPAAEEQLRHVPGLLTDQRVRIIGQPEAAKGRIGALKSFCAKTAKGDVLVELDHDDLLPPGILSKVRKAVKQGAGFVYSDDALFIDDAKSGMRASQGFTPAFGWETYVEKIWDRYWVVARAFEPCPRSLCEVYFAPDHIRAWSRRLYERIGGHNVDLPVGDDHDLIVRSYLSGAKFTHLNCCGYLYRLHADNTFKKDSKRLAEIVATTKATMLERLIYEWCKRHEYPVVRADASGVWAHRADRSVGAFGVFDLLEQSPAASVTLLFNELYRRLRPGGWLIAEIDARIYPPEFFLKFCRRDKALQDPNVRCRFQAVALQRTNDQQTTQVVFCALKGQRQPGPIHI